jgi:hypothetical protein
MVNDNDGFATDIFQVITLTRGIPVNDAMQRSYMRVAHPNRHPTTRLNGYGVLRERPALADFFFDGTHEDFKRSLGC